MNYLKKFFKGLLEDMFVNRTNRLCAQLRLFCIAGAGISVIMTVLNMIKAEYRLGLKRSTVQSKAEGTACQAGSLQHSRAFVSSTPSLPLSLKARASCLS